MATCTIESSYEKIRDQCLAEEEPWQDVDFPANQTSIGNKPSKYEADNWQRPHEICKELGLEPKFFIDGGTRFDINQGQLNNCWVLASLASLASCPQLLERVIPHDQSFEKGKYAGVFRFHFWNFGKWVEVLVDDRLPMMDGKLLYAKSKQPNEFWGALLEKAYAKLYGTYQTINFGYCDDALVDFTGCLAHWIYIKNFTPKDLVKILYPASERHCILSAVINLTKNPEKKGLANSHAYSITGVKKVTLEDGIQRNLLRIRDPHGSETEWNRRWGDSSEEWDKISQEAREEFGLVKNADGEFWIQFSDFLRNFNDIQICYMDVTDVFDNPVDKKFWSTSLFYGEWIKSKTAGGQNAKSLSFERNPQFAITVTDHDEDDDKMASFVVELTQMNRRRQQLKDLKIGFYLYRIPPEAKLPLTHDFLANTKHDGGENHYAYTRAASRSFNKEPGTYVIIPTTEKEDEEGEFMLRVFSEADHKSHPIKGYCNHNH